MTPTRRRILHTAALALAVLSLAGACVRPRTTTVPRTTPRPVAPVSHVYGASIEAQVTATPIENGDGRRWHAKAGTGLAYWADSIIAAFRAGPADVVIASPLYNDAINGGWTADDEAVLRWVAAARQRDDCLTVELPGAMATVEMHWPGLIAELNELRAFVPTIIPGTVDWQPVIYTDPTIPAADGLHLAAWGTTITPAVEARYGFLDAAANRCEARR